MRRDRKTKTGSSIFQEQRNQDVEAEREKKDRRERTENEDLPKWYEDERSSYVRVFYRGEISLRYQKGADSSSPVEGGSERMSARILDISGQVISLSMPDTSTISRLLHTMRRADAMEAKVLKELQFCSKRRKFEKRRLSDDNDWFNL